MKILKFLSKKEKGTNFFDLPAKDKKRIIKKAVQGSNELQRELSDKYDSLELQKAL